METEIRFGGGGFFPQGPAGSGIASLPESNEEFRKRYAAKLDGRPQWLKVLEQAFDQLRSTEEGRRTYGDPQRGATLPQAWRAHFAMSGCSMVCLLAQGRPAISTDGIPEVVLITAADLVGTLARGFADTEGFNAQIFHYDGRTGHSVTIFGHDPATGRFEYHDPWPDQSLLCLELNVAGVDAQPLDNGRWSITSDELARVIVATFLWPSHWAQLCGRPVWISYDSVLQSDFGQFFRIHEIGRDVEGKRTKVELKPGGFQQDIHLSFDLDSKEMIHRATLHLRRGWVLGPPYGLNPFAIDIAKSFLGALLPEPDQPRGGPIVEAIASLGRPGVAQAVLARREQPAPTQQEQAQMAFLGVLAQYTHLMTCGRIELRTDMRDEQPWLEIAVIIH